MIHYIETLLLNCNIAYHKKLKLNWYSERWSPIGSTPTFRLIMIMEKLVNDWQGKPKDSEKICPSVALSTIYRTCCPYANPGSRDGKAPTNHLRYGTAYIAFHNCLIEMRIQFPIRLHCIIHAHAEVFMISDTYISQQNSMMKGQYVQRWVI
jgi:hypothetical protein